MDHAHNRKNRILLAIITMIITYIAVSVYGVIHDMATTSTVFTISSGLPPVESVERATPFLEKIKHYFFPQAKMIVPIEKKVNIKGRVVYTNGNPYAEGLVELRSEPRHTYTDLEGYFIFENVEDGEHTVSILDQNRNVLASCGVIINRNIGIADVILVQTDVNTYILEVAVDVQVLEIVLEIERDNNGQPSGQLIIKPEVQVRERYPSGEQPDAPDKGDELPAPDSPATPSATPPETPPATPPGSSAGSPPGTSEDNALTVYSTVDTRNFARVPSPAADINVFGNGKRIAPGMSGEYKFTIDNRANPFAIYYDIDLVETNNSLNIPLKYRLYNNNTNRYVNGDADWHTIAQIREVTANPVVPLSMNDSMKTDYTLEWFWEDRGSIDNRYAAHAGEVACTLAIRVSAQRK
ncbi:MAG: carboxypeptidase-like regulatory domain-containing protein [Desulfosporosinus sp.]|jgi:hypothetical protein